MPTSLTPLGRFLRKLRIDNNELLKTMAEKLDVSSAFLSAVEMGRKKMPAEWENEIGAEYRLDAGQRTELANAIAESSESVRLNMEGMSPESRRVAVAFARKIRDIDEDDLEHIAEFLKGLHSKGRKK